MIENKENIKFITISLFIISMVTIAFALNFARPIMIPFVLALLIRILIDPIIDFQTKSLRIHRIVAVFTSLILIGFVFMIIVPFIVSSVATFLESADDYNKKVLLILDLIISELQKFEIQINRQVIRDSFLSLPFLDWASAILSNSANIISKFFLVIIITLFLLLGKKTDKTSNEWNQIINNVKKYIFTKFITSAATGILTGIIYWFIGLELALIFGTMTFLLNFIPVLGSVIAVLIPLPVALLQYSEISSIVYVVIFPAIVHIVIGNIIEPKMFGKTFGLHPITIILSLIFWGMIWGIIGVLLAAPITAIVKITFEQFQTTQPLARLLEGTIHHKI
tara:strand:+ start:180 stop:1190 length:1011 start_codon:yes stop_codon:yes gene_type:complete